jgi:hypothetical protein
MTPDTQKAVLDAPPTLSGQMRFLLKWLGEGVDGLYGESAHELPGWLADATLSIARARTTLAAAEASPAAYVGPARDGIEAQHAMNDIFPGDPYPPAPPTLSGQMRFLLKWLGEGVDGLYGETKGPTLESLIHQGLVHVGPTPAKGDDYRRVRLTDDGRTVLAHILKEGTADE